MNRIESYIIKRAPQKIVKTLRTIKYNYVSARGRTIGKIGISESDRIVALQRGYSQNFENLNCSRDVVAWLRSYQIYREGLPLVWADTPCPGNFGDWLAPYLLQSLTGHQVRFVPQCGSRYFKHYVGLGSIIGCANRYSTIIGSGVSQINTSIDKRCNVLSVRGPYTNEVLSKNGIKKVDVFGDPAFLLPRIHKPALIPNLSGIALVRHINHQSILLDPTSRVTEISINASHPTDLEAFINTILSFDLVVTSAMHCFLTCVAYGKKAILFRPSTDDTPVPGDGIKYRDALAGVELPETRPVTINLTHDLDSQILDLEPYQHEFQQNRVDQLNELYCGISHV